MHVPYCMALCFNRVQQGRRRTRRKKRAMSVRTRDQRRSGEISQYSIGVLIHNGTLIEKTTEGKPWGEASWKPSDSTMKRASVEKNDDVQLYNRKSVWFADFGVVDWKDSELAWTMPMHWWWPFTKTEESRKTHFPVGRILRMEITILILACEQTWNIQTWMFERDSFLPAFHGTIRGFTLNPRPKRAVGFTLKSFCNFGVPLCHSVTDLSAMVGRITQDQPGTNIIPSAFLMTVFIILILTPILLSFWNVPLHLSQSPGLKITRRQL